MHLQTMLTQPPKGNVRASNASINIFAGNDIISIQATKSSSLPALVAAFVPSFLFAVLYLSIFAIIRKYFRRIYSPRTYHDAIPEKDRTPSSSTARFEWVKDLVTYGDRFVLEHSSLDAFLYLRFLRTIVFICFIGTCITWPILFPVNATGGGTASQLDKLGIGNVRHKKSLYAHATVAWLFFGFVMFVVARERLWLIGLRQAWYLSKANASRLSSRTVLFLDPPKEASSEKSAAENFGKDATRQWFVTPTTKLDKLVNTRNSKAMKLESEQVSFLSKAQKKLGKSTRRNGFANTELAESTIDALRPVSQEYKVAGRKIDAIELYREYTRHAAEEVDEERSNHKNTAKRGNTAVFVEYRTQSAAQRAYRENPLSKLALPPLTEHTKVIGAAPKEIIWPNITRPHAARLSRRSLANAIVVAIIILWSIPSSLIGTLSNVNYLADNVKWLAWLKNLPDWVLGLMVGIIPPFLQSELSFYLPVFFRYIAKTFEPTNTKAELQTQAWFFAHQVLQVFLVTALSSSAIALVPELMKDPASVPMVLADKLPSSSTFYLTYFILQGLGSASSTILNTSDLFPYLFYDWFWLTTPRDKHDNYTSLKGIGWGKLFPKFTNFLIIAVAYSCISPLVIGLATIGLFFFYLSYRHNLVFVVQPKLETRGQCYTRALQQMLTGVYIAELALLGLFSLRKATGPIIMTAILLGSTIAYNIITNRYLNPLEDHFPDELLAGEGEQEPLLTAEEGEATGDLNERSRIQRVGHTARIPQKVLDPIAQFFEPHIYASHKAMKALLSASIDEEVPSSSDQELENAYKNPSLTSKTPKIWLPRDDIGISKKEVEANETSGIASSDNGAWMNRKGRVDFERHNLKELPVYKNIPPY